jgi:hypothetical protein
VIVKTSLHEIFNRTITNHTIAQLFHFFMGGVLTATAAEFLEFQPLGRRFAVLGRRIVPLFAVTAL